MPGFDAVGWTMICAPSATPKPIVDRLYTELKAVAATPEVNGLLVKLGVIPASADLTWKGVVDTRMWKQANAALNHAKK